MKTLRQLEYEEFLSTDFWKNLSKFKKESVENKCESCGLELPLEAHHKFYRPSWFMTRVWDLVALCHGCHFKFHKDLSQINKKLLKKRYRRKRRNQIKLKGRSKFLARMARRKDYKSKGFFIHY